jgi:hypothetical protein
MYIPASVDWLGTFYNVARNPWDPYQFWAFINAPWTALLLMPMGFFSERVSIGMNAYLNFLIVSLVIFKRGGNIVTWLLTITSLPFITILFTGAIEWIPIMAFLLPEAWGIPLLIAKPQTASMAGVIWFIRARNKIRFVLPTACVFLFSFLIWPNWPIRLFHNMNNLVVNSLGFLNVSFSPWPWGIPIGVILLVMAVKKSDDMQAAISTLFFAPYYAVHTVTLSFAFVTMRNRWLGLLAWILLWIFAGMRMGYIAF